MQTIVRLVSTGRPNVEAVYMLQHKFRTELFSRSPLNLSSFQLSRLRWFHILIELQINKVIPPPH